MADIFISYARADRKLIDKLASVLENQGHSVWWDRQIVGGAEFSKDIERELDAAKVVIVAWSADANKSHWVKDEASVARDAAKLVPICLNEEIPPMGFRQVHAVDFSAWKGSKDSSAVTDLQRAVDACLQGPNSPAVLPTHSKRSGRKRSHYAIAAIAILLPVAAMFVWQSASQDSGQQTGPVNVPGEIQQAKLSEDTNRAPEIAVAAIKVRDTDPDLINLAAALSEDIASGLSRFSYLLVTSEGSTASTTGVATRYLLEGTLRKVGQTLRLTTQLMDASSGEQVWGETFDRAFDEASVLDIQDDLTDHVVASVADPYGALMRHLSAGVALKTPLEMTSYETILRFFIYRQRIGSEDHLLTRTALEHGAELSPGDANVWAALAATYSEEYKHSYNVLPESLDRALNSARKAVDLEPSNAYANFCLAEVYFFKQDLGAFRAAAERAIELNPRDSDAMAMIGIMMAYGGDWDRSVELTTRAMALNPNHPGWYRFNIFFNQYRQGNYSDALDTAQRINMPSYFADPYVRAIAHAQLEHKSEAAEAMQELRALWPDFDLEGFRKDHLDIWIFAQPELIEQILDGLQKAES
jgi:TolB-like protein/Tfp pilus assembly protein PilF